MPNKENIRAWVEALRSGRYKQGIARLNSGGGRFCCLGVACDVYHRISGLGGWDVNGGWWRGSYLPAHVIDWLGVDSGDPAFNGSTATFLNDHLRWTFPQIADAIEKEYNLAE